MDGRRTYLDSLNAGRQRRAQSTLDELNRSLERLGERLERRDDRTRGHPHPERHPHPALDQPRGTTDASRLPWREEAHAGVPRDDAYMATTGRLAAEVKGLREELRHQMSSGLQREFDSLREEISRAYAASAQPSASARLSEELEELSDSIRFLSSRSDDKSINLLRLDIEQLKSELESLAREETVRSMEGRWDRLDQRWNDLEHRIDARSHDDPALEALSDRLQQMTDAVNNLPEALSLRSLEDKVRTLAGSVDHFSQQEGRAPQLFAAIEQRLDEISRAIVASANAQSLPFDFEPIRRIEGRIASLAEQLDDLATRGASTEIVDRLNALSLRIDDVARQGEVPAKSVERLATQISVIADKIDAGSMLPDADEIMRGLESRFDQFAEVMERRQDTALEASHAMFRDLETRLHDVIAKLDHRPATHADNTDLMEVIDARFNDFSRRLEARKADLLDRNSVRDLEAKIDTITSRFENTATAIPQVDPDAIRSLESQVAGLSALLSRPDQANASVDTISPRLEQMEKAIRGSRDMVIDAARRAAEDVVRSFAGSSTDAAAAHALTQDLKTLEAITRRSDDRNSKTFEAIHDTLLKIVDRLSQIENAAGPVSAPAKVSIKEAPSIDPVDMPVEAAEEAIYAAHRGPVTVARTQPASADALAEAVAPVDEAPVAQQPERQSMFRGLGRVLSRKKPAPTPQAEPTSTTFAEEPAPSLDLDQPLDPKTANRPLQPGSGTPDLSRIVKRVRDERAQQQTGKTEEADAAKSDFIAAARRAAQAAAAEAEVLKRHSDMAGPNRGFKLGELLRARRKPILMGAAAVMIALAGLQLGKAFLSDRNVVTGGNIAAAPQESPVTSETTQSAAVTPEPTEDTFPTAGTTSKPDTAMDPFGDVPADMQADRGSELPQTATGIIEDAAPAASAEMSSASADTMELSDTVTASVAPQVDAAPKPAVGTAGDQEAKAAADVGPVALREAADAGDPKAMFEIGARYSDGRGAKADNGKAAEWYERAAESGLAPAQYRIGNMYEKGIGVERDLAKAKTWYQMAAEQGNASAMHNLAVLYAMGADGTTDNESAGRWFNKAAELGVKDSQFNLGILNAKGVGMPQNLEESYKWFALVADAGDRDAASKRDEIANSLRPEQLERARAAVASWKAKPVDATANVVDVPEEWQESQETTASVDMTKAVKTIQLILNKNGYDAGGADGVMGQKTKNAIIAFQKDNGLKADGQVTEKLVQELLARK